MLILFVSLFIDAVSWTTADALLLPSISSLRFDAWIVIKVSFSSYLTISTRSRDADAHADMLILFSMCVLMLLATMAVHALSQHTAHASP